MSAIGLHEYELEDEFEDLYESEGEYEDESEAESEQFFGALLSLGKRALQSPTLRRAALSGARAALGKFGDIGGAIGGDGAGGAIGKSIGSGVGDFLGGLLPQSEGEYEFEFEDEFEYEGELEDEFEEELEDEYEGEFEYESEYEAEINPIRRIYPEAMMEHLGHAIMEAESESEAEAFARAIVPVAAHRIPHAAPALKRAAPQLLRGVSNVAKTLLKHPSTRPLVRALPTIVRNVAKQIARQSHGGRVAISPKHAVRILAHHTAKTLGSPKRAVAAYQRSKALDHHLHRAGSPVRLIRGRVHYARPLPGGGHSQLRRVGWPGRNHWYWRYRWPQGQAGRPLSYRTSPAYGQGPSPVRLRTAGGARPISYGAPSYTAPGNTPRVRYGQPVSYGQSTTRGIPRQRRGCHCHCNCCSCGRSQ